jgi:hypothetical protein
MRPLGVVASNRSSPAITSSRLEAEAAGIELVAGTLTIDGSLITNNSAVLSTSLPNGVETTAGSGGIHVQARVVATVRNTIISGNAVSATSLEGDALAFCGGICADGTLAISGSTVSDNSVTATTLFGSASVDSGGLGTGCCEQPPTTVTISGTRFADNSVTATAPAGTAMALGGGITVANDKLIPISDSLVSGNRATATTTTGSAIVHGGGIANGGLLTVRNTTVSDKHRNREWPRRRSAGRWHLECHVRPGSACATQVGRQRGHP